jgi:hypothetical protein
MEEYKDMYKDLPQLIVALDSLGEDANYIHIKDANENTVYYCPCCRGIIKPRAYKDDREYQVQAHYYHETGGCNDETFVHFICKTWLFESGCKLRINEQNYTVEKIETEKTYHTKFGDYRPDITVYTKEDKTFFFEIKNTNKKTEHYIPKWDELGNDVVEVDVRYFINQKFSYDIPEFNLIYSDGKCFIKLYTKSDYDETIAKRKLEWKRQDKLNYKIMWERLDWFWNELQNFKTHGTNFKKLLYSFNNLPNEDKEVCFNIVKKMSCVKDYNDSFRDIINSCLRTEFTETNIKNMFPENVIINRVQFIDREGFYIYCNYKSLMTNKDLSKWYHSREWIFRYSKIKNVINKIKNEADEIYDRELKYPIFCKEIDEVLFNINLQIINSIWELNFEKPKTSNWKDGYKIYIKIKNAYNYNHEDYFWVSIFNFDDISQECILNYIIEKLQKSMNEIYNYIIMNDGKESVFRHVFILRNEEENECPNN